MPSSRSVLSQFDELAVVRGLEHVSVPTDENKSEVQELDHGTERKVFPMGGADPVAFAEGLMFVRHARSIVRLGRVWVIPSLCRS